MPGAWLGAVSAAVAPEQVDGRGEEPATVARHGADAAVAVSVGGAQAADGKTLMVMLNAVEDLASSRGWLALPESVSSAGFPDRLARTATDLLNAVEPAGPKRRLSSLTAAGFGIGLETVHMSQHDNDLRAVLSALGDVLAERGTGLLITVDELQGGDFGEIREFGSILQHVSRREQRPIAFLGAALPQIEDTLLSDDAATFLQRCARCDVGQLTPRATRRAIAEPISGHGRSIDPAALDHAITATSGYAFIVQLVGFHSWHAAGSEARITAEHVEIGIAEAQQRIGRMVFAPTWRTLSDMDRRFLLSMARDDGESKLADIAGRLEVTTNYAGVYRHRLTTRRHDHPHRQGPHHPRPQRRPGLASRAGRRIGDMRLHSPEKASCN